MLWNQQCFVGKDIDPKGRGEVRKRKKNVQNAELNNVTFTDLILFMDKSNTSGKFLKRYKTKDYEERKASLSREKLKKNFDKVSAPAMVKTER
jgi:hypothetical protein